jgi:hypothetical protein
MVHAGYEIVVAGWSIGRETVRMQRLRNGHLIVNLRGTVLPPDVADGHKTWEAVEVDPRAMVEPNRWIVVVDAGEHIRLMRGARLPIPGTVILGALVGVRSPVPEAVEGGQPAADSERQDVNRGPAVAMKD